MLGIHAVYTLTVAGRRKIHSRSNQIRNNTHSPLPPPPRRLTRQTVRVSPLIMAAWNIRSISDNLKGKTALGARQLARNKVDIAALKEARFYEQGQSEEVCAGHTFFWSDRPKAERRDACVAFAIRNYIVGRLPCLPQDINDHLRRGQQDVLMTKATLHADGWTDSRLVTSKMRVNLQPSRSPQGKRPPDKLNIAMLSLPAHHLHFINELARQLANLPVTTVAAAADENASVENRCCQLPDIVQSTAFFPPSLRTSSPSFNLFTVLPHGRKSYGESDRNHLGGSGHCYQQSAEVAVTSGVSRGSVIDPTLLIVYVNDCANELDCDVPIFADDIKIWSTIRNEVDEARLQTDLDLDGLDGSLRFY
ncbi:hypothetical protein SprV_0702433200 [Sparganum proliferum]